MCIQEIDFFSHYSFLYNLGRFQLVYLCRPLCHLRMIRTLSTTGSRRHVYKHIVRALGSSTVTSTSNKDTLKRILKLALPERRLIGASMGTLVVTSGISLLFPVTIGKVLDLSLTDGADIPLEYVSGGLLGLFVLQGGLIVLRSSMLSIAGERLIARLRKQLFSSTLAQDLSFFDKTRTGELINRLSADTQMVQKAVTGNLVGGLRNVFIAIGGTAMLLYTSPTLAFVSLSVIPPVGLGARYFGRYVKSQQRQVQDALAETSTLAEEVISNVRTVRQFAGEPFEVAKYDARVDSAYAKACRVAIATAWFDGGVHLAANCSLVAVLGYGGSLVLNHEITAGSLTSFLLYSLYVGVNVTSLSTVYSELMKGVGASSRVFSIIDQVPSMPSSITSAAVNKSGASTDIRKLPPSILKNIYTEKLNKHVFGLKAFGVVSSLDTESTFIPYGTQVVAPSGYASLLSDASSLLTPPVDGSISFSNVEFSYPSRQDFSILKGVNLQVARGETVALVGSSGSGKSTMGQLLMRLYDPTIGTVSIDDVDIRTIDPHWLRMHIGVVAQEPLLFSGTIEENIRYGNPLASEEEVRHAADASRVTQFAENFPDKIHTKVGERGIALSGGQKQRVVSVPCLYLLENTDRS